MDILEHNGTFTFVKGYLGDETKDAGQQQVASVHLDASSDPLADDGVSVIACRSNRSDINKSSMKALPLAVRAAVPSSSE